MELIWQTILSELYHDWIFKHGSIVEYFVLVSACRFHSIVVDKEGFQYSFASGVDVDNKEIFRGIFENLKNDIIGWIHSFIVLCQII